MADTSGDLSDETLTYLENGATPAECSVFFTHGHVCLRRQADIRSETELFDDQRGRAKVQSPWGVMELETRMIDQMIDEDRWFLEYEVLAGDEVVTHQKLIFEFEGDEA